MECIRWGHRLVRTVREQWWGHSCACIRWTRLVHVFVLGACMGLVTPAACLCGQELARPNTEEEPLWPAVAHGKFGYVDRAGRFVIPPIFDQARNFVERLACVQQGGKWGFIDRRGRFAITPRFDWAYDFSGGIARAGSGLKTYYLNPIGDAVSTTSLAGDADSLPALPPPSEEHHSLATSDFKTADVFEPIPEPGVFHERMHAMAGVPGK